MNRKISWLLAVLLLTSFHLAQAQQANNIPRIGFLASASASDFSNLVESYREGLRELGYVEGRNIAIEYRFAERKLGRVPELAAELVRQKVDVFTVAGTVAAKAAKKATSTTPIVVAGAGDLVGAGLIASLSRPGGNITGSTSIAPDLSGKRLELLKEVVPQASRVAVVWDASPGQIDEVKGIEAAGSAQTVKVDPIDLNDMNKIESVYAAIVKQKVAAVIIVQSSLTIGYRKQLAELALKHRLPSMCEQKEWTNDGCLMSYGPDVLYLWRRAAYFVDKILKGAKTSDLPVEQPTNFELVINLKTAKQIGLTIPPNVLARADRVIR